ncbi:MAG TPA: hypothetical protein VMH81_33660 [Bryobacteraceae bacterium]|nr:hypothetical protein [Bryobacteraceae bacterium]
MRSRILFISGNRDDARHLSQMLENLPLVLDHVGSIHQACTMLQQNHYAVILTETAVQDGSWKDVLQMARDCPRELQVLVTDLHGDARLWAEVLNLGAYDLVAQPFYQPEVCRILLNACRPRHEYPALAAAV